MRYGIYKKEGYYCTNVFKDGQGWFADVIFPAVWIEKWGFKNIDEALKRADELNDKNN